jgi:CHC2 zinc finger
MYTSGDILSGRKEMENNWVDFKAIKSAVTLRMVLDRYQINWLRKSGEELRGRCPIHQGEGQQSFHVSLAKNAFNCFSCKARGMFSTLLRQWRRAASAMRR